MEVKEFKKEDYIISTDPQKLQIGVIHQFLSNSYWAKDISLDVVKRSIGNSFCFGVYKNEKQIGFARLITDYATFAYLADVFILNEHRNHGLSKWLLQTIIDLPEVKGLRSLLLKTKDAHGLYTQFGFNKPKYPERIMEYSPLKLK